MMRRQYSTATAATALLLLLVGATAQQQGGGKDIITTAEEAGDFTQLLQWLRVADLENTLQADGPLTFIAPTDEAFAALSPAVIWKLKSDVEYLSMVLRYHVVQGKFSSQQLARLRQLPTLQGEALEVEGRAPRGVRVIQASGDARVTVPDVQASNGVIHVVDKVILPPSIQEEASLEEVLKRAGNVNEFLSLVKDAGLLDILREGGPLTVFAPTDAAIARVDPSIIRQLKREPRLLKAVILSHMVGKDISSHQLRTTQVHENSLGELVILRTVGNKVLVNTATVVKEDLIAKNGALHIIDGLLLPSINALGSQGPTPTITLISKIKMSGLTIFSELLQKSGVFLVLESTGPLTIFGPSDEAFSSFPREEVLSLLSDPMKLRHLLLRHILAEKVPTSDFREDLIKENFGAEKTRLNVYQKPGSGNVYTVNGVQVSVQDEGATNGVLHIVPSVLHSTERNSLDVLREDRRFSTFLSGVQASDLIAPIRAEDPVTIFAATNDAFRKLPQEDFFSILLDLTRLSAMLGNHVIPSNTTGQQTLYSPGLCWTSFKSASGNTMRTAMGSDGHILITSGNGRIAKITETDIVTSNGVIHVVNDIL